MGAIVDTIVIVITGFLGVRLQVAIPEKVNQRIMEAIGLSIMVMGMAGAISGNTLVLILSMVIGATLGEWLDIDGRIHQVMGKLQSKFKSHPRLQNGNFTEAFISATMLFCVGSMVIVGSIESGLTGDNSILYTKSLLDGITAFLLASSLGSGVIFGALPVLVIEGGITILASFLAPLFSPAIVTEIVAVGSVLLFALGLNLSGLADLKVMNFVPAILFPPFIMLFM